METQQVQVREWKQGETLDNLAVGDVARFCNVSDQIDGTFLGLYCGKQNDKHFVYSRRDNYSPKSQGDFIRCWAIVIGNISREIPGRLRSEFLFDLYEGQAKLRFINAGTAEYDEPNKLLEEKGL